ncbi:ectonucleoside triphosphate diphosphohydrolase 1 isoform X1 [Pleurodeles waltl]|uniref:ectonucleoside triphosphate diphosphohydrolase 1 isoform X1 n=1 Tax=Pleurodeles waltl TaxID=8319 RepID=UPI003709A26A
MSSGDDHQHGTKQKKSCQKNVFIILGFLFILAIITIITVAIIQNKPLEKNVKYGIVLDAGSSHTNLYIYEWPAEKENDTGVVKQVDMCKVDGPGISSYYKEPEKAGLSLKKCMDEAKGVVPENRQRETPLYLGATAGMRLLSMVNPGLSDQVLSSVENNLELYPFDYQGARIITGQEEGAYGWITINYLLGKFVQDESWLSFFPGLKGSETFGALDLGGASTQITFVPENDIESPDNSLHFRLYGRSYNVYTHSFLCYGKDQALQQLFASNIKPTDTILQDPCFNVGYTRNVNVTGLYKNHCTAAYRKSLNVTNVQVIGTGNHDQCLQNVLEIFNRSQCTYSRCSFNGVFQPHLQGDFGAFSAFFFVMDFLKLADIKNPKSLEDAKETVRKFCSRPWQEVKVEFPKTKEKYLSEYCFSGTYILSLLEVGYGFNSTSWDSIRFVGKISGSDAGWTLGYMLNLTNMIPAELPPSRPLSHEGYVALMVVSSLVLVAVLLIIWLSCCKEKCLEKGII